MAETTQVLVSISGLHVRSTSDSQRTLVLVQLCPTLPTFAFNEKNLVDYYYFKNEKKRKVYSLFYSWWRGRRSNGIQLSLPWQHLVIRPLQNKAHTTHVRKNRSGVVRGRLVFLCYGDDIRTKTYICVPSH